MNSLANLVHEAQCADRMFQQTTKQYKKEVRLLQRKIGWYENILVDYQLLVDKLQKETLHKEKKVRKWKGRCRMLTAVQPIKREKKESKEKKLRKEPNEQTIDLTEDSVTQPPQMVDDVLDTIIEDALVKMDTGEVLNTTQPVVAVVTETEEEEEVEVEEETEEEVEVEVEEETEEEEEEVEFEETEEEVEFEETEEEVEFEETEEEVEFEETEEEVEVEVEEETEEEVEVEVEEETEEEVEVEETEEEEEVEVEVEEETEEEEVEVEVDEEEEEVDEEEEEVEETEEEEEEEEEVFMVTIKGKQYFTNDETNGTIYSVVDEDDIGDEVGHYKNGVPVFA
jgi:hypothetical protein